MLRIIGGLLLALTTGALADGVPLIAPGPALAASEVASMRVNRPAKSITPVAVNPGAIEGNVITVDLGGKTYRFVGTKRQMQASISVAQSASAAAPADDGGDYWEGKTPEGDRAFISRTKGGLHGQFSVGEQRQQFELVRQGKYAIVEIEPPPASRLNYDEPSQATIDAIRKRQQPQGGKP